MEITFEREALYQEVWVTPLTQLAKKYSLSDNGLRKVCTALNIPLPERGHWSQIAAGHQIQRPPLPPTAERTTFVSHPLAAERSFRENDDETWLAERISYEEVPHHRIEVELQPKRWHQAVRPLRDDLVEEVKELPRVKRDADRAEKNYHVRLEPDFQGWKWQRFLDTGQVLCQTHRSTPMRVTPATYERALAVLNSLCFNAELRGFAVALDEKEGRIVLEGFGGKIEVRITERLENTWRQEKSAGDRKPQNIKTKTPTGELRLYIGQTFSEVLIADGADTPLERKLNEIFERVYGRVVRCREEARKHEAWEQQREEERRQRQEEADRARALEEVRESERRRRRALLQEARAWRTATLIRDYVSHVENEPFVSGSQPSKSEDWRRWARAVADEMDPTVREESAKPPT